MTLVRLLLVMTFGVVGVFSAYEAGRQDGRTKGYQACLGEQDEDRVRYAGEGKGSKG